MAEEWEVQQLRDQVWALRNEIARVDSDQMQRLAEVEEKLVARLERVETWVENQRVRHASTPVWLFGIYGMVGSTVSILISLYAAGVWK